MGPSGSGKSTFAARHFLPTEIISSDRCRALVSDDENNQAATKDAFDVLHFIAAKRLAAGRLTVIDATNVQPEARKPLIALAKQYHVLPVAIVLNLPEQLCRERNRQRSDREFKPHVIHRQSVELRQSLRSLHKEGFNSVSTIGGADDVEEVERTPLYNNLKHENGPFDIIGDVHGCYGELTELLHRLGWQVAGEGYTATPPAGRKAIFLGDLVDRGPDAPGVLKLVMNLVAAGHAFCVPGNHDDKLLRTLQGKRTQVAHGLAETLTQLEAEGAQFREKLMQFLDRLVSHYVLDGGRLVVAHAGLPEEMHGRASGAVRSFALFGETTGEADEYGLPVRLNWAASYRGRATVVYGHSPVPEPQWLNGTINIDTGCAFGGALTALRYPERELVSVEAARVYCEPARPLKSATPAALTAQQAHDDVLDIDDLDGRRTIITRLHGNVVIPEENARAALEAMSRFAVNPKWLIYLPPTMSPTQTSDQPDLLEHPKEAFTYFRQNGVERVVCQEKHMGSRAVLVLGRDEDAIRRRFGIAGEGTGICYTRTGRRFFADRPLETAVIDRTRAAITAAGLWEKLNSDWVCLDAELMPWSAKARDLLLRQYAAVGAAGRAGMAAAAAALAQAGARGLDTTELQARFAGRAAHLTSYVEAYQRYCWNVATVADLKLAPFHLLASEGAVHIDKDHLWHMETLAELCRADATGLLTPTPHRVVDLNDDTSDAVRWWEELTARGGEGMVVKPLSFTVRNSHGTLVQPAVKCRGREYLRIIYGPEYTAPGQIDRLRSRGLSTKRSLALREFALGVEALERFVAREPLRRIHECVFGVLALESEAVDPRL